MPPSNYLTRNREPILFANYELKVDIATEVEGPTDVDGPTGKTLKRTIIGYINCDKANKGNKTQPNFDLARAKIVEQQMVAALQNPQSPEHAELLKEFGRLFGCPAGMKRIEEEYRPGKGGVELHIVDVVDNDAESIG